MSIFLTSIDTAAEIGIIENFLDKSITFFERIGDGGNSQVYHLETSDNGAYVAKFYFRDPTDIRDRLGTEFSSLSFLCKEGIRAVPKPIAMDEKAGCAVYQYIEGEKVSLREITTQDIEQAVDFCQEVKAIVKQ